MTDNTNTSSVASTPATPLTTGPKGNPDKANQIIRDATEGNNGAAASEQQDDFGRLHDIDNIKVMEGKDDQKPEQPDKSGESDEPDPSDQ